MKKLTVLLLMILAFSVVMQAVTATPITGFSYPFKNCISIKTLQENFQPFQEEYDKLKNGKSVNIDLLCQYNTNKESCKQCILTEIQEYQELQSQKQSQKIKQQIIIYSVEGILLLITGGLFYFLIRTIRKPEIKHKKLKIFFLIFGIIVLLFILFLIFNLIGELSLT